MRNTMEPERYRFSCGCEWPVVGPPPREGALPLMDVDEENLPFCSAVWDLLATGRTKGVFQLEKSLGQTWAKKLKPECVEHTAALAAILRPGCLKALDEHGVSMTEHYCLRKNNQEPVASYHPVVDQILAPTYGVLVYQEQSMQLARAVAGYSLQEADNLRKAIGKKLPEVMAKCRTTFLDGAAKAGILSAEQALEVFGWIEKSQRYSFNRSHAVSYGGLTSCETAYVKAHFPVAFFANWLRYAQEGSDPQAEVAELVQDARLFDVPIETPDARVPEPHFYTDGVRVVFGLSDIRGVGQAQIEKLKVGLTEAEARLGERPATWEAFLLHAATPLHGATVKGMISVGEFRWCGKSRTRLLNEFEAWDGLTETERERARQLDLVGRGRLDPAPLVPLKEPDILKKFPDLDRLPLKERLKVQARVQKDREKALLKHQETVAALRSVGPLASVEAVLQAVARPRPVGGCANARRRTAVESALQLLRNPPASEADHPNWVAWAEEHYLGVAISCSRVDSCDLSQVNCSCKDFLSGRAGYMVLGVEVQQVREVMTRRGKSAGKPMAFLTVADGTCAISDVCIFADAWERLRDVLREGATVAIEAERDAKKDTLVVKRASPI
jgi:DNA polymerase III alpha subunit